MEIIGDKEFKANTKKALKFIKKKSPKSYEFINFYIENIIQNNFSYLYPYNIITYYVNKKISSNLILYASYILREAYHSYLIQCSLTANINKEYNCYDGMKNFQLCNKFQIKALKKLGASEKNINIVQNKINNKIVENNHVIQIIGDKEFTCRVKDALLLLKEKDYLSYKTVIQNIKRIIYFPSHKSTFYDRFQEVPTCCINKSDHNESIENLCGALLHEACHNKLYKEALIDGKNPDKECCGYSAEMYCLTREIECMKNVGANDELIKHYIDFYDIRWWENNEDKRILKH